jgi:iron transport multicopper oxidase
LPTPATWLNNSEQGQYVDGLRAPLVIHPSKEVHSYDAEFTIVLGDWYHQEHSTLLKRFISIADPDGGEPVPGQLAYPSLDSEAHALYRQTRR